MGHQGLRIVPAQFNTGHLEVQRFSSPGRVEYLVGQLGQLAADEAALRVKALALADRIEDTEIRLRVTAA